MAGRQRQRQADGRQAAPAPGRWPAPGSASARPMANARQRQAWRPPPWRLLPRQALDTANKRPDTTHARTTHTSPHRSRPLCAAHNRHDYVMTTRLLEQTQQPHTRPTQGPSPRPPYRTARHRRQTQADGQRQADRQPATPGRWPIIPARQPLGQRLPMLCYHSASIHPDPDPYQTRKRPEMRKLARRREPVSGPSDTFSVSCSIITQDAGRCENVGWGCGVVAGFLRDKWVCGWDKWVCGWGEGVCGWGEWVCGG